MHYLVVFVTTNRKLYYEHKINHRNVRNKEVKLIWICLLGPMVHIIEDFFLKKMYENVVGTSEVVRNREVAVLERRPNGALCFFF